MTSGGGLVQTRDAAATKARILSAAVEEFAERGHAGGRIERVASAAGCNVRMIYAYFGSKQELFDAAWESAVLEMAREVPPTAADLPSWAGRVFDFNRRRPQVMRIAMWAQLERPPSAGDAPEPFATKIHRVSAAADDEIRPADLLSFVYALAQAWFFTPIGLLASDGSDPRDPARIDEHRSAVVAAVERLLVT